MTDNAGRKQGVRSRKCKGNNPAAMPLPDPTEKDRQEGAEAARRILARRALAKLRRGGEQKVKVEHVHVHSGGQAIVGSVQQPGGGVSTKSGEQAHGAAEPRALVHSPPAPLWSEEPGRPAVPAGGGEGQEPVHDARRGQGQRRSEG